MEFVPNQSCFGTRVSEGPNEHDPHHQTDRLRNRPADASRGFSGAAVQRSGAGGGGAPAAADGEQDPEAAGAGGAADVASRRQGRLRAGPAGGGDLHGGDHRGPRGSHRHHGVHQRRGGLLARAALPRALQLAADQRGGAQCAGRNLPLGDGPQPAGGGAGAREAGRRQCPRRLHPCRASRSLTALGPSGPAFRLEEIMQTPTETIEQFATEDYKFGFITDVEQDIFPPGLSEDVIRALSAKKEEPEWMLEWRLKAYRHWLNMEEPTGANVHYPPIDYQSIAYYAGPKPKGSGPKSLDEVDPEILATYEKLGIPLREREMLAGVAVDAVFDSVSVATTFKAKLAEVGIIFCSFSEAVRNHPDLIKQYLGSVVPYSDNFFATLNSAVFSDGSFVYIPKGVRCPMELSTYFRINALNTGQFERTLIVADEGAYVSYLEGCTAPMRDENQLHAAVVELVALKDATIKYSTVQNWYP